MGKRVDPIYPITQIGDDTDVLYDVLIAPEEQTYDEKVHKEKEWKIKFTKKLIAFLEEHNYTYRKMPLPCFDYIINRGAGTCIEMKSVKDFISSATGKAEKGDGETRLMSQCIRMADPTIFPDTLRKALIIRDGLNKRMIEQSTVDEDGNFKTKRLFQYSPISEETVFSEDGSKQKLSDYEWQNVESSPEKPLDVNRWLGYISHTQLYVRVIELGGENHTIDFFRWQLDKAKRDEADVRKGYSTGNLSISKASNETPDYKRQQIIVQNFVKKLGASRVHKLLTFYGTLDNFFKSVKTPNDFAPASTKKDGTLDKITEEVATEYFRIIAVKYEIPKDEEEKNAKASPSDD